MVPAGEFGALVALRAKQGEFDALKALPDGRVVQPLLELDGDKESPEGEIRQLARIARKLHQFGRLIMVDAGDLKALPTIGGEQPGGLAELADTLQAVDLFDPDQIPFIPVARSGLPASQLAWIGRLCNELGAGGALRIRREGTSPAEVERALGDLRVDVEDLDLILDLQYVESFAPQLAEWAAAVLSSLSQLGVFRSTTLLSGSVPGSLDQTALWEKPRFEEMLWKALVDGGLRQIRLGDYGVAHPGPGVPFPPKHVAVKYTCPGHWLFGRERMKDLSSRGDTLAVVCRHLVESDSFSGPEFSWGDGEIASGAAGLGKSMGSTSKPAAIGTSHHLAYLTALQAA